ncbi:MAG: hypothetical protein NWE92_08145 [Candidatus Bathyarchaeota archaeon]|nr:hypothetical protein [Candidatus Bathyarchaeota archaeon]
MSNRWVAVLVAVVFFAVAFLILYQQKVTFGVWFQLGDIHHETFAIASVALAVGVLVGAAITQTSRRPRK